MDVLGWDGVVGGAAAPQHEGLPPFCTPVHPLCGLLFFHSHANVAVVSLLSTFAAIEERLPLRPKLGPRLERAPDGPLRPRHL